jgi:hypothetical protein
MGIAYDELIKPYEDPTPPGTDKRTPSGQREWLLKRGIPEAVAVEAMEAVYTEIAAGRVFSGIDNHPAGYTLDRCLLTTARSILRGKQMAVLSAQNYAQIDGYVSRAWKDRLIDIGIGMAISAAGGLLLWRLIL